MAPVTDTQRWNARQHDVVSKRTTKGATVQRVTRRGKASVRGSFDRIEPLANDDSREVWMSDDAADAARVASVLLSSARRRSHGLSTDDILKITDVAYRSFLTTRTDAEPVHQLIGSDVMSWEQMIAGDRADRTDVAAQRSWLSGPYRDTTWDAFAADTAVYRANTRRQSKVARFPVRQTKGYRGKASHPEQSFALPIGRHRSADVRDGTGRLIAPAESEPIAVDVVRSYYSERRFVVEPTGETVATEIPDAIPCDVVTRHQMPAEPTHRFIGHKRVTRPAPNDTRKRSDKVKRAARTIGTVDTPDTVEAIALALDSLNRTERVVLRLPGDVKLTVARGKDGRYSSQRDGAKYRTRTAQSMAERLAH